MGKQKMKIPKSIARRIKITRSGKLLRRRGFGRHLKAKKSSAQKRVSRKAIPIEGVLEKKLKKVLGIGK